MMTSPTVSFLRTSPMLFFSCADKLTCPACRLYRCLEFGMTAASLALHFDLAEDPDLVAVLDDFKAR